MILTNEDLLAISQVVDTRLEKRLKPIEKDIHTLKEDVHDLKIRVGNLETDLKKVKIFQENVILPRLNTIESCYTDTYRHYQRDADRMEVAFDDIDLLKKVVTDHSEKLQKLA